MQRALCRSTRYRQPSQGLMQRLAAFTIGCFLIVAQTAFAAGDPPSRPATVEEAAKVLDLTKFPLLPGAVLMRAPGVAGLLYEVKADLKQAFEFQRQKLGEQKWKELPNGYVSDQVASGSFARDGYVVSVSVIPQSGADKAGVVTVTLNSHGNVDPQKLPLPPGTKPFYQTPVSAAFLSEAPVAETAEACRKLLLAQGWQPYGSAGDSQYFKQNAVRLAARVMAAPAQGNKTVIDYSTELMSADLPVPAEALRVQYSDSPAQLSFDLAIPEGETVAWYRPALAKLGFKPTTENLINIDFRKVMLFLNAGKDRLTLELTQVDGKTRGLLQHQTAAEIAEIERQIAAEEERKKKEREKPLPRIAIRLPEGAREVEQSKARIEFKLAAGKARGVVDDWRKKFKQAGWTEERATIDKQFGDISLTKDGQSLSLTYIETGVLPAEITVTASRAELEREK